MHILQLCKKFPYPVKDGESLAISYLGKALHHLGCKVSLLAMNTIKHHADIEAASSLMSHYQSINVIEIDNRLKPKDAFLNLFSKESYHISRFESEAYGQQLIDLLTNNEFDLIQLETLYLAPYIPTIRQYSKAKIIMRSHNVEHEIWERITANTTFGPKKWYLSLLTEKLRRYEVSRLNDYDLFAAITQRDLERYVKMGFQGASANIPIGIDIKDYHADFSVFNKNLSISFIGSLDWMPNIEGLKWFLDKIWDDLQEKYPNISFHIAGRNTPDWLHQLQQKNVIVHGEVEDAHAFINAHPIMVVPLQSGSGMRVKILEAMALGRVVITTSIGVEGIHAIHQKEVLIADDKADFIQVMNYCKNNADQLINIGKNAQKFIGNEFDNIEIAKKLLQKCEQIIHSENSNNL
ncbi:MAG: glycosyltransferase involved in cell wall biosynthesis [Maribacter sp.]|jgi:glycosyltransferase involved in cell wall biosynthesis